MKVNQQFSNGTNLSDIYNFIHIFSICIFKHRHTLYIYIYIYIYISVIHNLFTCSKTCLYRLLFFIYKLYFVVVILVLKLTYISGSQDNIYHLCLVKKKSSNNLCMAKYNNAGYVII